jgi:hypothetical protein
MSYNTSTPDLSNASRTSRSPVDAHAKLNQTQSRSYSGSTSFDGLGELRQVYPRRQSVSASASFENAASRERNWPADDPMDTRGRPRPDSSKSPTWSYHPKKGFHGEELEACRIHIARQQQGVQSPSDPQVSARSTSLWQSDPSTASTYSERTHTARKKARQGHHGGSIFAQDPENWRHICFVYLIFLMLIVCRMASQPTKQVAERLAKANAMQA